MNNIIEIKYIYISFIFQDIHNFNAKNFTTLNIIFYLLYTNNIIIRTN